VALRCDSPIRASGSDDEAARVHHTAAATWPLAALAQQATNTTGICPAASAAGRTDGVPEAIMMSTLRSTSSVAALKTCAEFCAMDPFSTVGENA
jgi:hypothetical protein